jgi:hypothetical protein
MTASIKVGSKIRAKVTSSSSFYLEVEGNVTAINGARISIQATMVKDRYSKEWKQHPTSCAMNVREENATLIEAEGAPESTGEMLQQVVAAFLPATRVMNQGELTAHIQKMGYSRAFAAKLSKMCFLKAQGK